MGVENSSENQQSTVLMQNLCPWPCGSHRSSAEAAEPRITWPRVHGPIWLVWVRPYNPGMGFFQGFRLIPKHILPHFLLVSCCPKGRRAQAFVQIMTPQYAIDSMCLLPIDVILLLLFHNTSQQAFGSQDGILPRDFRLESIVLLRL